MFGASKGRFAVDHPVVTEKRPQEGRKSFRVGQQSQLPMECQLATGQGALKGGHELAAKDAAEHLDRQKEAIARMNPLREVKRQSAGGNHAMDMGMIFKLLRPSVKHAEEADF